MDRSLTNEEIDQLQEELRNRKMRLLLYALRSPIWSEATAPLLDGVSRHVLQRIPLIGSLMTWLFISSCSHC